MRESIELGKKLTGNQAVVLWELRFRESCRLAGGAPSLGRETGS